MSGKNLIKVANQMTTWDDLDDLLGDLLGYVG